MSRRFESRKEKAQVAAPAHNDRAVGELIADAMEKVGAQACSRLRNRRRLRTP